MRRIFGILIRVVRLRLANAVKDRFSAQEYVSTCQCRGGAKGFLKAIHRQACWGRSIAIHGNDTIPSGNVNSAVGGNGRRKNIALFNKAHGSMKLVPCGGLQRREYVLIVAQEIEHILIQ